MSVKYNGNTSVESGQPSKTPFLIGVGGGTASGKSTVCGKIMEKLGEDCIDDNKRRVVCISQDSFYKELSDEEKIAANKGCFNFDHPNALENELMLDTINNILAGKVVQLPVWEYTTHSRKADVFMTVYPADVVLFEGILAFYFPEIRNLFHMKLFVDTDPDTRLSRRVLRDVKERGRDLELVLNQYTKFVKPAFEEFCQPTKKHADVIIPRGADNEVAIDLIVKHIESIMCRVHGDISGVLSEFRDSGCYSDSSLERRISRESDESSVVASR
ncbi:hypothetical protein B4U80_03832 [Leptotrombidium deliense]|uniref:uridine/cytidine kinase n=1 Tax=Leptotrombidium deliense TaxID=299467 RepID=A0A443SU34_9ACAR|nr:hypothetical protein B4U80_03832 [Leptotrombidium deliense]